MLPAVFQTTTQTKEFNMTLPDCGEPVCVYLFPLTLEGLGFALMVAMGVFIIALLAGELRRMWG